MTHHRIAIPVQTLKFLLPIGSLLLLGLLIMASCSRGQSEKAPATKVLHAMDFGLVADGVTDDCPELEVK